MYFKTHVLLKKELLRHFQALSSTETKVFVAILIMANPKTGKLTIPMKNLAQRVNLSYRLTNQAVIRLQDMDHIRYFYDRTLRESRIEITGYQSLIGFEKEKSGFDSEGGSECHSEVTSQCHKESGSVGKSVPSDIRRNPVRSDTRKSVPRGSNPIPIKPGKTVTPGKEDQTIKTPAEMHKEKLIETIAREFGETKSIEMIRSICKNQSIPMIEKAFESTRKIPEEKIKRSRIALLIYFLKKHAEETK